MQNTWIYQQCPSTANGLSHTTSLKWRQVSKVSDTWGMVGKREYFCLGVPRFAVMQYTPI